MSSCPPSFLSVEIKSAIDFSNVINPSKDSLERVLLVLSPTDVKTFCQSAATTTPLATAPVNPFIEDITLEEEVTNPSKGVLADAELKFLKSIVEPLWINLNNFTNNNIS